MNILRYYLLVFVLSLIASLGITQNLSLDMGPEKELIRYMHFNGHLASDKSGHLVDYYLLRGYGHFDSTHVVEKYDNDFELLYSKELKFDTKKAKTVSLLNMKDRLAWVTEDHSSDKGSAEFSVAHFDFDGTIGKKVPITKIGVKNRFDMPISYLTVSGDTTDFLLALKSSSFKGGNDFMFRLVVMDENFLPKWNKDVLIDTKHDRFKVLKWVLADNDDVYVLAKVYDGNPEKDFKKEDGEKVPNYKLSVYHFSKNHDGYKAYDIKLKDSFAKGAIIGLNSKQALFTIGFYAHEFFGPIVGVFANILDAKTGEVLKSDMHKFTIAEKKAMGEANIASDKSGNEGLDPDFSFRNLYLWSDGTVLANAEENYARVFTSNKSTGGISSNWAYYSKDIISIIMGNDGKIDDITVIPKRTVTWSNNKYNSFHTLLYNGNAYFFHNLSNNDFGKTPDEEHSFNFGVDDMVAVMSKVDGSGKITKQKLLSNNDEDMLFMPIHCSTISENKLFFMVQRRPKMFSSFKFKMGVITVK